YDVFARRVGTLGPYVAHGGDPAAGNLHKVLDVRAALPPDANVADAHRRDRRRRERPRGVALLLGGRARKLMPGHHRAGERRGASDPQKLTSVEIVLLVSHRTPRQ